MSESLTQLGGILQPLYTMAEAAGYLGVPRTTFQTWARGYERRAPDQSPWGGPPVLTTVTGAGPRQPSVPFVGLTEGFVLQAFRRHGVPLQRIRPAIRRLQDERELAHPLAAENLYTDGAEVFYDYARARGDRQLMLLTVAGSGQRVLHDVLWDYLRRIEYREGMAFRLHLPITGEEHVLFTDPEIAFGQPLFRRGGARLRDVLQRIKAGEQPREVALDYEIPLEDVMRARDAAPAVAA